MRVARGPLGFPLPSMLGPKICVESVPEPEDSSPVQTWILGYFWSLPRGVSPRLERGMHVRFPPVLWQLCGASLASIKGSVSFHRGFPRRLSHETIPRGCPTGLSHVPPWCESILGLKAEAVRGKQVSLEQTETYGGLWEWWHDPGVPLAFPVESACS